MSSEGFRNYHTNFEISAILNDFLDTFRALFGKTVQIQ